MANKSLIMNKLVCAIVIATGTLNSSANPLILLSNQYAEYSLEELMQVSIATGTLQSLRDAPAVATVITEQDIKDIGATDLDEILETVPGLHVARNYTGYNPIYTVRGVYSNLNPQILMLINGIPITVLLSGNRSQAWGGMPVNAIKSIEIIRGPGSAVYGAEAFAGVINIITKKAEDMEDSQVGVRLGSFDTRDIWMQHAIEHEGLKMGFIAEYHDTDGHKEIISVDRQTAYDEVFGTQASLAPGPVNMTRRNLDLRFDVEKEHWQWRLGYQGRHDQGIGIGSTQALDDIGLLVDDRISTDVTYHNPELTEHWDVTAQLSFLHSHIRTARNQTAYPPGAFGGAYPDGLIANPSVSEHHTRLNLSAFYKGFDNHTLRFGGGYYWGDIYKVEAQLNYGINPQTGQPVDPTQGLVDVSDTPYTVMPEVKRKNWHVFFQDIWNIANDWEMTLGVRYDRYSDFGSTTNPRLALVWKTTDALTTKFLYGRAFRTPGVQEMYAINNSAVLGNPELQPENMETAEIAFDYQPNDDYRIALNIFKYRWTDAIVAMPAPGMVAYLPQNVGEQEGQGLETEMLWRVLDNFSLLGNYSYQESTNVDKDHDAGYSPHQQAYLRANWHLDDYWSLHGQVNWVAERKRAFGDDREAIDDYTTFDALVRYTYKKANLALSARNLTDADAREPSPGPDVDGVIGLPNDLPLAGRHYWLEFSYKF